MLIPWPKNEEDKEDMITNARLVDTARNELQKALTKTKSEVEILLGSNIPLSLSPPE